MRVCCLNKALDEIWQARTKNLRMFSNLRIFRDPIKPLWEVPQNRDGGKFVLILNKPEATHKDNATPPSEAAFTERNERENTEALEVPCDDGASTAELSPRDEHADGSGSGAHGHGKEKASVEVPLEYKLCLALMVLGLLGPVDQFCGCVLSIRAFGHMISIWVSSATVDDDTIIQDIRHNIASLLGFPLEQISFQRHNESIRNNTRNLSKTETRKRMREARAKGDVIEPPARPQRRKSDAEPVDDSSSSLTPVSPRGKSGASTTPRRPSGSKEKVHFQESVSIMEAAPPGSSRPHPAPVQGRIHPPAPLVIPDINIMSGTPPTRGVAPIHLATASSSETATGFSYAAVAAGSASTHSGASHGAATQGSSVGSNGSKGHSPRKSDDEGGAWRPVGTRSSLPHAIAPQQPPQGQQRRNEPFTTKKRRAQSASAGQQKPDPNYVSPEALFGADLPLLSPTITPHPSVPPSPPSEASDDLLAVSAQERAARNRSRNVVEKLSGMSGLEPVSSTLSASSASSLASSSSATTSTLSPRSQPNSNVSNNTPHTGRHASVSVGASSRPAASSEAALSSSPPETSSARRRNRGRRRKSTTDTAETFPVSMEDGGESRLEVPVAHDH